MVKYVIDFQVSKLDNMIPTLIDSMYSYFWKQLKNVYHPSKYPH